MTKHLTIIIIYIPCFTLFYGTDFTLQVMVSICNRGWNTATKCNIHNGCKVK